MSRSLHVGTVYQIEYGYPGLYGGDGQEALYKIFIMFDIPITAVDCYDDDYEVDRDDLRRLRKIIAENGPEFQEQTAEFEKTLSEASIDKEQFITALDSLINDSDQRNSYVYISWF